MERTIKISNCYLGGPTIEVVVKVELREASEFSLPGAYEEYLEDELYPLTGTGRDGVAGYFAESIDGLEPVIKKEWLE